MKAPTICFGRETALQILRTVDPAALTIVRSEACKLPRAAPYVDELERSVEQLRAAHPGILIENPFTSWCPMLLDAIPQVPARRTCVQHNYKVGRCFGSTKAYL